MYSLDQLYFQAMQGEAMRIERNSNISYIDVGIKISKYPSKTEILNCSKNGDYFRVEKDNVFLTKNFIFAKRGHS